LRSIPNISPSLDLALEPLGRGGSLVDLLGILLASELLMSFFLLFLFLLSLLPPTSQYIKRSKEKICATHLGLVNKLDKRVSLRSQILRLDITSNNTRQLATNASVILGSDLVKPLHAAELGGCHVNLASGSDSAGSDTVVGGTGECADDTESDDDGQVESVGRVPDGG
jgi:hypothetical protein